jgi:hypothetical protein
MLPPQHIHRLMLAGALAFALLASIMSGPAGARPAQDPSNAGNGGRGLTFSHAGTPSAPQDLRNADNRTGPLTFSHAGTPSTPQDIVVQGAGDAAPVKVAYSPPTSDDDTPWLLIAALGATALGLVATTSVQLRRRHTARAAV